uniref:H/ACA ribonucleoprotein complex non-core subunit NAF1 n=1 Tax=Culex tarsalis TaxID=7177 RepID=A0A1Q3EVM4_CULTA
METQTGETMDNKETIEVNSEPVPQSESSPDVKRDLGPGQKQEAAESLQEPSTENQDCEATVQDVQAQEETVVAQPAVETEKGMEETSVPEIEMAAPCGDVGQPDASEDAAAMDIAAESHSSVTDQLVVKQEAPDMDMDMAEDFTRRASDFPTVPQIKQEQTASIQEEVANEQAAENRAVLQIANSSLSLLSQYISSDSEANITDSEEELPRKVPNAARQESSGDSSDDDSVEVIPNTSSYRNQDKVVVVSDTETAPNGSDNELDSGDEEAPSTVPIRARGEVLPHELPPIEELQISVREEECKPVGHVQSIVAQIVIVQSYAGVELLNLDTVLFLEKGKRPLGKIFDVIGQVAAPMYCVLFNSRQDVISKGITVGTPVYCAPQTEHTQFIILSELMKHKGTDASWLDDIETPEFAQEFSDDEEERRARRRRGSSCSSSGRQTPEGDGGRRPFPYRRGRGRGSYRGGQRNGHSWHHNIAHQEQQPQRVINPFALAAGMPPPPPPPSN